MKQALDCTDIKALLSGLVDDEVDGDTRYLAERHLADCKACRGLVNEAEGLNQLLMTDADALMPSGLPVGFENAVLSRTVFVDTVRFRPHRWTTWTGWLAAAASIALAGTIWMMDRSSQYDRASGNEVVREDGPQGASPRAAMPVAWTSPAELQSSIWNAALPADTPGLPRTILGPRQQTMPAPEFDDVAHDLQNRPDPDDLSAIAVRSTLAREDSETLFATSVLLWMLEDANLESFDDLERIREAAEYDNLLERLAKARAAVEPADRPLVLAAEGILLRIVQGPIDLGDLRLMHDTVAAMDLSFQIQQMSNQWVPEPV